MLDLFDPLENWNLFVGRWGCNTKNSYYNKYDKNEKYHIKYGRPVKLPINVLKTIRLLEDNLYAIRNYIRVRNIPRSGLASGILPSSPDHIETSQSTGRGIPQCEHLETEYQPYEPENNAPESLSCADCGADLELERECI
tara:strand:- start:5164 stop:5583 length:420 start_codon:yes stop_codon:yes gene_type:complete